MILVEAYRKFLKVAWFLPGFLLYAAFPPMCEKADVLFALAPLMWLSRTADAKTSAKRWFQSGIFFWVATLSWMPAIVKNGGPWPLVLLGWGALSTYCAAFFAAYGFLSASYWRWVAAARQGIFARRLLGVLVVEPILWAGLELVRSRFGGGFAWNSLGVVAANANLGLPAAFGGVYLLSALIVLVNGTFAGIGERMVASVRARLGRGAASLSPWRSLETVLALLLVVGVFAFARTWSAARADEGARSVKVALVQRNFPCVFKEQEEDPYEVYSNLLANAAFMRADLLVLPESAMSEFGAVDSRAALRFARWAERLADAPSLLAGGTRVADGAIYNAAALYALRSDGTMDVSVYDKVHLVPFGEFIPGDKIFPWLQRLAPVGSCTPGEPRTLTLTADGAAIPFGVGICFEDTDSALMRAHAASGAKALIFITNDSWFSRSNEPLAHAWQATARAIETGLPVVRVGNSGVTGTIRLDGRWTYLLDADGRVLVDARGVLFDRVAISEEEPTPYVRFGDAPLAVAFVLVLGLCVLGTSLNRDGWRGVSCRRKMGNLQF